MSKSDPFNGRTIGGFGPVSTVLREVMARRAAGEPVTDDQVIADHADLGLELTEGLKALRFVEQAEFRARSGSSIAVDNPPAQVARPVSDPSLPRDAFAGYEIQSEIHRGGQGLVYLAIQQTTHRAVAIKVLREHRLAAPDARARFEREVQVLSRLQHPNIVTIHDSGISGDACYLVMDYIAGRSLDEHIAGGAIPLRTTLQLFVKIAWAVHAAHVRGIIHRDLKPSNVRIDDAGEPHVLDFGLAKLAGSESDTVRPSTTMTVTGQFVGSLPWASPEQAEGASHRIDSRCDIYALGVMLYHALTERFPYDVTGTFAEVLHHIMHTEPQRPGALRSDINDEIDTIVLKCLAKDLQRRYQSAAELARDLERFLAGEPIEAKRDSTWYLIRKMVSRHRVATTAACCVFVMACASAISLSILYRAEAQAHLDAERSARRASAVQHFLQTMLVQPRPTEAEHGDGTAQRHLIAREVLDDAGQRIESELGGEPEVEAAVRSTIGRAYHGMGLFAEARTHLRRALEIRQSLLSPVHPELATSLNNLGELMYDLDDLAGAEVLFRQALHQRRQLYPDGHPELAESLRNLGWVLQTRLQYGGVESLYAESLAMLRRFSGSDSIEAANLLSRWGQLEFVRHHFDAARAPLVEARDMLHRLDADQSPQAATLLIQLGKLEEAVGRIPEAESLLRKSVELTRRVHGQVHPDVAWSLQRLGMLLCARGCYSQAEPILREACAMNDRLLAQDSPYLARSYESLGQLLLERGDLTGAQRASQTAIEVWGRRYAPNDPYMAWYRGRMGCVLVARRDLAAAEPLLVSALKHRDIVLAEETEQVVANLCALAAIHQTRGDFDRTLATLLEALDVAKSRIGQDAPQAATVMTQLGAALTQAGDLAGAQPFLRDALLLARQRLGEDHPTTALCLHNFAHWLVERNDAHATIPFPQLAAESDAIESFPTALDLARRYADDALRIRRNTLQFGHVAITESLLLADRVSLTRGNRSGGPNARSQASPGQRPGNASHHKIQAPTGRNTDVE